jgi:hypothetical protein
LLFCLLPGVGRTALAGTLVIETGKVGRHDVTDSASAPGVICRFAPPLNWSLGETWLQVRPPMMLARDVTAGHDRQLVGWRAVVLAPDRETGAWQPLIEGPVQRTMATDIYLAAFESRGPETQFHLGYGAYHVRMELFWYEGTTGAVSDQVVGRVVYEVEHYAIVVRHRAGMLQTGVDTTCQLTVS